MVHIGWFNPSSGALHRNKMDLYPGRDWERVYLLRPAPMKSRKPVTPDVIAYLLQRSRMGEEHYGEELQTDNGRDPLIDELEELADALMYRAQHLIERDGALPPGGGIYER